MAHFNLRSCDGEEELWAGEAGHAPGSVEQLRSMQAAGLGFVMPTYMGTVYDNQGGGNDPLVTVHKERDVRLDERDNVGLIGRIVSEVVNEVGVVHALDTCRLESVVREVIASLAAIVENSLHVAGGDNGTIILPAGRFGLKAHVDREAQSDWFEREDEMFRVGSEGRNQALAVGARALRMHHLGRSENKRSLLGKARWTQPSEKKEATVTMKNIQQMMKFKVHNLKDGEAYTRK